MPVEVVDVSLPARSSAWKWWVCGLLLLATMLNYMDRLTLNITAKQIMEDFGFNKRDYGYLEAQFAYAFALGSIIFGWLVDRANLRWIYPAAVLAWSAAGFATGLMWEFYGLLACRFLLGLAEGGNWASALRTTQHILPPSERSMGNSILQSGAAFGAILTPLIIKAMYALTGTWRWSFMVIGLLGGTWIFLWLGGVRREDLPRPAVKAGSSLNAILGFLIALLVLDTTVFILTKKEPVDAFGATAAVGLLGSLSADSPLLAASSLMAGRPEDSWLPVITKVAVTLLGVAAVFLWLFRSTTDENRLPRGDFIRRFCILAVLVVVINVTWHYFRAWLPLFLQTKRGYSREATEWFSIAYYVVTDIGTLTAGFVTLLLARRFSVHRSRLLVFGTCALITTLSVVVALLPPGPLLLVLLLLIGFAALGLFPNYYSFSQEITIQHQGKVTGALGCTCWLSMSLLHVLVGDRIERTGSYVQSMSLAGLMPLLGLVVLLLFWGKTQPRSEVVEGPEPPTAPDDKPIEEHIHAFPDKIQAASS
jgi:ACS family hexuronate transporter-like MFS transporter